MLNRPSFFLATRINALVIAIFLPAVLMACTDYEYRDTAQPSTSPTELVQALASITPLPLDEVIDPNPRAMTRTPTIAPTPTYVILDDSSLSLPATSEYRSFVYLSVPYLGIPEFFILNDKLKIIKNFKTDAFFATREMTVYDSPAPCHLVLNNATSVLDIDLTTGQQTTLFDNSGRAAEGSTVIYPALSPSGKWVSYAIWRGEIESIEGGKYQDVEIVPVNGTQARRITTFGGASLRGGEWSPASDQIAYSDYLEDLSSKELFVMDVDTGTKRVLSDFNDPNLVIGAMQWSPYGNQLAVEKINNFKTENHNAELWLFDLEKNTRRQMNFPRQSGGVNALHWSLDSRTLFVKMYVDTDATSWLYWIDPGDGTIIKEKSSKEISTAVWSLYMVPLTEDLRHLVSFDGEYIYDSVNDRILMFDLDIPEDRTGYSILYTTEDYADCFE